MRGSTRQRAASVPDAWPARRARGARRGLAWTGLVVATALCGACRTTAPLPQCQGPSQPINVAAASVGAEVDRARR